MIMISLTVSKQILCSRQPILNEEMLGATALCIKALSITTFSTHSFCIKAFSLNTFNIKALGKMTLRITKLSNQHI
jgi:hypothetical protein